MPRAAARNVRSMVHPMRIARANARRDGAHSRAPHHALRSGREGWSVGKGREMPARVRRAEGDAIQAGRQPGVEHRRARHQAAAGNAGHAVGATVGCVAGVLAVVGVQGHGRAVRGMVATMGTMPVGRSRGRGPMVVAAGVTRERGRPPQREGCDENDHQEDDQAAHGL